MDKKTVCFSGHRPEKLPGGGRYDNICIRIIKSILYLKIKESIQSGYNEFISGLARGIDLWAAMIVLEYKVKYPNIRLVSVKPTASHGSNFKGEDKFYLEYVLNHSDEVVCTSEKYVRNCYKIRNEYMVDRSDKLIAAVSDYKSGTGHTIKYAEKCGMEVSIIDITKIVDMYDNNHNANNHYNTI